MKLQKLPLLEIKTINGNKKQRSYQVIETSGFDFWRHKRSKRTRTRNKVFIKSQKAPFSNFISINQAKNKERTYYQSTETCRFGFEVRNEVKGLETKFLLRLAILVFEAIKKARKQEINVLSRHRNFPFWFLKP